MKGTTILTSMAMVIALFHALPCTSASTSQSDHIQCTEADTIHFRNNLRISSTEDVEEDIPEDVVDITFILPRSNETVMRSIKTKIRQLMGCKEKDDYTNMAREIGQKFFAEHRKEMKEEGDNFDPSPWAYYATYKLEAISPKYITITYYGDDCRGGAHGNPFSGGFTVLRENGHILTWKDFSDKPKLLLPFIEEGFGELRDTYMAAIRDNHAQLPLPVNAPWIVRDDIIFEYEPNEIGCYAMGEPLSKISLKEYDDKITDVMIKPAIKDMIYSYDHSYDIMDDEEECEDSNEENGDDEENGDAPYTIIHDSLSKTVEVEGTPCIESFMRSIPSLYNKEYGWFVEPEIDNPNGFFHYSQESSGRYELYGACWNRKDGKKLLIVSYDIADFNTHKGHRENFCLAGDSKFYYASANMLYDPSEERFLDCETGFAAFIYNDATKTLETLDEPPFNGWDICKSNLFLILPQHGKDIKVREGVDIEDDSQYTYHTLKWNGMTFDMN